MMALEGCAHSASDGASEKQRYYATPRPLGLPRSLLAAASLLCQIMPAKAEKLSLRSPLRRWPTQWLKGRLQLGYGHTRVGATFSIISVTTCSSQSAYISAVVLHQLDHSVGIADLTSCHGDARSAERYQPCA